MFRSLRRRLTGLYTITTGLILTLVMAGALLFLMEQEKQKQLEQFQNQWVSISSRVQYDTSFTHSWLAQTEANSRMILHIEENKEPLRFQGSWKPKTDRNVLLQRARELAEAEGVYMGTAPVSSYAAQTSLMTVEGDHKDRYYARVMAISTPKGVKSLCLLSYMIPGSAMIKETALYLGVLYLMAIAVLCLFSWYFVGWSLRPAEETQKKQAAFIASASHELRSPLAVLRSSIGAVRAAPEKQETLLTNMDKECQRMGRLVSDMLLLASADAGTWTIRTEAVELDTLLLNVYELFLPFCREKGVDLQIRLPEYALRPVEADSERLTQVLTILLDNALCYTPSGEFVMLSVSQTNDRNCRTVIEIMDHGCGIPDSMKPYIFDRFYQGDASRTDKQHFGLGLSIAYELVRLHQGTIMISDGEDGGSVFRIIL